MVFLEFTPGELKKQSSGGCCEKQRSWPIRDICGTLLWCRRGI